MLRRAIVVFCLAAGSASAHPTIVPVSVGNQNDTEIYCINSAGDVAGRYRTFSDGYHSFVRYSDGTVETFDPPDGTQSQPMAIDDRREIIGMFYPVSWGLPFLRRADGTFKEIRVRDMDRSTVYALNHKGTILGATGNDGEKGYGFTRAHGQGYELFQMPDDMPQAYLSAINDDGAIAGSYGGPNGHIRFYIRTKDGQITTFAPDGRRRVGEVRGLNAAGAVVGNFFNSPKDEDAFVRWPDGRIELIKIDPNGTTQVTGINASGTITGWFDNGTEDPGHGFLRKPDGTVTVFDYPDAYGTLPLAINDSDVVTGWAHSGGAYIGFIRTP